MKSKRNKRKETLPKQALSKQWLKLIPPTESTGDSVIKVAYCLSEETLRRIAGQGLPNPYLLVIVAKKTAVETTDHNDHTHSYEEVQRQLVPLKQGLFYLQFQSSGEFLVQATIVAHKPNKYSQLHSTFVIDGRYYIFLDRLSGELIVSHDINYDKSYAVFGEDSFNCEVTAEFFAKEPPNWVKTWVNLFYDKNPIDQCQFRKRIPFAFTAQPIILMLWLPLTLLLRLLLAFTATLLGYRGINYTAIWQIREKYFFEVWDDVRSWKNTIFLSKEYQGEYHYKARLWSIPFFPVFPILFVLLSGFYSYQNENGRYDLGYALTWESCLFGLQLYIGFLFCIFGLILIVILIMALASIVSVPARAVIKKLKSSEPAPSSKDLAELEAKSLSYLTCEKRMATDASVSALPSERRTIKLRFLEIKSKVCRPYQTLR